MKTNSPRRILLGLSTSLALGAGCAGQNASSVPMAAVQDLNVPILEGWKKGGFEGESVYLTKSVASSKVILVVNCDRTKKGARLPKTTEDLVRDVQRDREMTAPTAKRRNIQVQILVPEQPTEFQGMPAVVTEQINTSPRGVARNKTLRFTNGQNLYSISSVVSSPAGTSAPPEAQAQAEEAWKILSEGIRAK